MKKYTQILSFCLVLLFCLTLYEDFKHKNRSDMQRIVIGPVTMITMNNAFALRACVCVLWLQLSIKIQSQQHWVLWVSVLSCRGRCTGLLKLTTYSFGMNGGVISEIYLSQVIYILKLTVAMSWSLHGDNSIDHIPDRSHVPLSLSTVYKTLQLTAGNKLNWLV